MFDSLGCEVFPSAVINSPDSISIDSAFVFPVTCFGDTNGQIRIYGSGGILPYSYILSPGADTNVTGKTTAEMMQEATFTNWDFVEIWNIGENQTYPYLRFYSVADLNHDGCVDFIDVAILGKHWLEYE